MSRSVQIERKEGDVEEGIVLEVEKEERVGRRYNVRVSLCGSSEVANPNQPPIHDPLFPSAQHVTVTEILRIEAQLQWFL